MGIEENYLLKALKDANEQPNQDFHLSFSMHEEMNFFKNKENANNWRARLDYFEQIDMSISPIFEAVYFYGKWKQEKNFQFIEQSVSNFEKMEQLADEKKWFWVLSYCITEQINICFEIENKEKLKAIAQRITEYLTAKKEVFKPHTFMELTREFARLLDKVENDLMERVYSLIMDYLQALPLDFSFQKGFLNACLSIKKAQKDKETVKELHRKVLDLKLSEAESKGKNSKLLLRHFLEDALTYNIKYVNDKALTIELKKKLSNIDFRDELVAIELPEQQQTKLRKASEKRVALLEETIKNYVNSFMQEHPIQVLYQLVNDESIFNMRIDASKEFIKEMMQEHRVPEIFGSITVYLEHKDKKLDSQEKKADYELNTFLVYYLRENLWVISQVFSQLLKKGIINFADIYIFLKNCTIIDENNLFIIMNGLLEHLSAEYISSISILTPKIESAIYRYLKSIGADVSCYADESISKRMLGGLIDQKEIEKNFSLDFQYFLKLLLISDDSMNFRNRFAHGEVSMIEFNETLSSVIIFSLIKIYGKTCQLPKEPQNTNNKVNA